MTDIIDEDDIFDVDNEIESMKRFQYKYDTKSEDLLPYNELEVAEPLKCGETPAKCCIKKNGSKIFFVMDCSSPMWLKIPRFYCKVHNKYFYQEKGATSIELVKFFKITMTKEFYYWVSNMYLEFLNFSKVRDVVESSWRTYVQTNGHLTARLNDDETLDWYLHKLYVSVTIVRIIVLHFWRNDPAGRVFFEEKRRIKWSEGAEILRGDRTFKIASTLGGYDPESKIMKRVNGRVYSLVNEKGYLLDLIVVPDGTNKHVADLLEQFWSLSNEYHFHSNESKFLKNIFSEETKYFFTDCDDKDANFIKNSYFKIFKKKNILIGQDRWHMIDRIRRALPNGHPDKKACLNELRRIFNLLNPITDSAIENAIKNGKPKPTKASKKKAFLKQIDEWETKYTTLSYSDCLTFNETVEALGEWMVSPDQPEIPPNPNTFEVLRVVGERVRNDQTEYEIQWKGYSVKHNEWVPEKDSVHIKTFQENTKENKVPILRTKGLKEKIKKMKSNKGIFVSLELSPDQKQGTSQNETVHNFLGRLNPLKAWLTLEMLDMKLLFLMLRWNNTLNSNYFEKFSNILRDSIEVIHVTYNIPNGIQKFSRFNIAKNSNINDLLEKGYTLKKNQEKYLSEVDEKKLVKAIKDIKTGVLDTNSVRNMQYWIREYIFSNTVTDLQLKNSIKKLEKESLSS